MYKKTNLAPLSQLLKRSLLLAAHVIFINLPYGESTGA